MASRSVPKKKTPSSGEQGPRAKPEDKTHTEDNKKYETLEKKYEDLMKDIHKIKLNQAEQHNFQEAAFVNKEDFESTTCRITKAIHGVGTMFCSFLTDETKVQCEELSNIFIKTLECAGETETTE